MMSSEIEHCGPSESSEPSFGAGLACSGDQKAQEDGVESNAGHDDTEDRGNAGLRGKE